MPISPGIRLLGKTKSLNTEEVTPMCSAACSEIVHMHACKERIEKRIRTHRYFCTIFLLEVISAQGHKVLRGQRKLLREVSIHCVPLRVVLGVGSCGSWTLRLAAVEFSYTQLASTQLHTIFFFFELLYLVIAHPCFPLTFLWF